MELKTVHKAVCSYYNIEPIELFLATRKQEIVERRQMFQYLARKLTRYSMREIGEYYSEVTGKVWDHATVNHASKHAIPNLIQTERRVSDDVHSIMFMLRHYEVGEAEDFVNTKKDIQYILIDSIGKKDLFERLKTYLENAKK